MAAKEFDEVRCPVCNRKVRAELGHKTSSWKTYTCPNTGPEGQVHAFNVETDMKSGLKVVKDIGIVAFTANAVGAAYANRQKIGKVLSDFWKWI